MLPPGLIVDHSVHEVSAGDAVEPAGEKGAGDVLLLDPGGDRRVQGARLVVRRRRDVNVIIGVVHAAELAVEIVA